MRLVDDDAAHGQLVAQAQHMRIVSRVYAHRMARALEGIQGIDGLAGMVKIACPVHGQHRGKLFTRVGVVRACSGFLDHQEFGPLKTRSVQLRERCDARCVLRRHGGVQLALGPHGGLQLALFRRREQHAAGFGQCGQRSVIHRFENDHAVFRRATGGVVEGLGAGDALRGCAQLG